MKCPLGIFNFLEEISQFISVQFSHSVVSNSLQSHESQHARPPCPSPTPGVHSDSSPSSQWCHPAISSSVIPFSSCPQSLQASESFPMSQLFAWSGQSTGVSALASFFPKKSQFSLSHSIVFLYFSALITEEGFLISSCYSLELCIQMLISFLFSFLLFTAICKASPDSHFASLIFLSHGDGLDPCLLYDVANLRP